MNPDTVEAPINILIVDDEPRNLAVLETVLTDSPYRLVRAASADEALLALIDDEFALLILDISMPGMSGFELAQMIKTRKKTAHVPIIFLTAFYNEDQHALEGYSTGAVDYLHKPVNPAILRSKVSVFADLYRKNREIGLTNRALIAEIEERRKIEEQLRNLNETLELRVIARTEELHKSEETLRQLANSMPQMVWTARHDGRLDYYNARWVEFTGFGEEMYGGIEKWAPLLHSDDLKQCYDAWAISVQTGEEYRMEHRLWDKRSNRYCWYLGRAVAIRNEDGRLIKWIGTCTDIDEQKRSEEDLRKANQTLEQFAFAASHDLQEPLRNIAIYTQLLKKCYGNGLNEEAGMFMSNISSGALRMSRLLSDLLEYTQISGSNCEPALPVNTETALAKALANLARAIQESGATVTHDALPFVFVNEVHVEQLLQNLVGNSIKYRRDECPPAVHISAWKEDTQWHFTVRDNGIGIEAAYKDQIFGVFKRLHVTGEKYSGNGIGLAICQRIVENYEGRIWVESELGVGSTFHFTIPERYQEKVTSLRNNGRSRGNSA
jgi:PAS domain S-box-containing protein